MSDIAMCVGLQHYPWPHDFSEEAKAQGVSKAISATNIPYIEPGKTRLALIHPRAWVEVTTKGMSLLDLCMELVGEYVISTPFEPSNLEKEEMLARCFGNKDLTWEETYAYERLMAVDLNSGAFVNDLRTCYHLREADRKKDLDRLEEKYGIKYSLGFIGYTYVTEIQYVALDEEEELPDHLKGKGITIVRATYEEVE